MGTQQSKSHGSAKKSKSKTRNKARLEEKSVRIERKHKEVKEDAKADSKLAERKDTPARPKPKPRRAIDKSKNKKKPATLTKEQVNKLRSMKEKKVQKAKNIAVEAKEVSTSQKPKPPTKTPTKAPQTEAKPLNSDFSDKENFSSNVDPASKPRKVGFAIEKNTEIESAKKQSVVKDEFEQWLESDTESYAELDVSDEEDEIEELPLTNKPKKKEAQHKTVEKMIKSRKSMMPIRTGTVRRLAHQYDTLSRTNN